MIFDGLERFLVLYGVIIGFFDKIKLCVKFDVFQFIEAYSYVKVRSRCVIKDDCYGKNVNIANKYIDRFHEGYPFEVKLEARETSLLFTLSICFSTYLNKFPILD